MRIARIPILNYHKIEIQPDIGITSRHPAQFERDMRFLHDQGFRTITFESYAAGNRLPEKPLILTFDDGYQSVFINAFPILETLSFKAVIFMPTAFIGKTNDWDVQFGGKKYLHLNRDELQQLSAAGFEIASHGRSHQSFTSIKLAEVEQELVHSKQELENLTGKVVQTICYPFGRFNQSVLKIVERAGYQFGMASLYFGKQTFPKPELALRRFNIYRQDSLNALKQKTTLNYLNYYGLRDRFFQLGAQFTPLYQKHMRR